MGRLVTELGVRKELPDYSYFSCYLVYMVVLVVILYAVNSFVRELLGKLVSEKVKKGE